MKNISLYLLFVFGIVVLYGFAYSTSIVDDPDGKSVFVDKKCQMCHTVQSFEITSNKKDATDLSSVGNEMSVELIVSYLKKETEFNGKLHPPAFRGTDEELQALSVWLGSLKAEAEVEVDVEEEPEEVEEEEE